MRYLFKILLLSFVILVSGCTKEQGCTNIQACNFSQSAEEDDGSCYLPGEECDDGNDSTILDQYTNTCQCEGVEPILGCTNVEACNYAGANTDDGSCEYPEDPCDDGNSATINNYWSNTCVCDGVDLNLGCTNDTACNYSAIANTDDGSCYFIGDSCNDGSSATINDTWNNSCICTGELPGCTSTSACNYNSDADLDDGSCYFIGDNCDDGNSTTINDTWSGSCSCTGELPGCTSTSACNYNSDADLDDGSCYFIGDSCDDGNSSTINDTWNNSCICAGELPGCTSTSACNYNSDADLDDGSCYFIGDSCDDGNLYTTNDTWSNNCSCVGQLCGSSITHEGYDYPTIQIGEQCWFAENCRYLPYVSPSSSWSTISPKYYVYDYQGTDLGAAQATDNYETYGVLYNFPAVMTEDICPSGWHIPSDGEFTQLTNFLNGESVAGYAMKSTSGWDDSGNGSNSSGFDGLPGGVRYYSGGSFLGIGFSGCWWSSSVTAGINSAWFRDLYSSNDNVQRNSSSTQNGRSARCVRD